MTLLLSFAPFRNLQTLSWCKDSAIEAKNVPVKFRIPFNRIGHMFVLLLHILIPFCWNLNYCIFYLFFRSAKVLLGIDILVDYIKGEGMFSEDSYPHSCIEEELKTRLKIAQDSAYDNYENAVQKGRNVVDDIKKDTNMYKNNTKMRRVFTQLHSYKNDIQKQINNLEKLKDNIREEYKDYLSVVVKAIVENAQDSLMKSISNRTEDRDQADNHIQDAKNEFKRQAQEDLKKDRNEAEEATEPKYAELHKQMIEVAFNEDLNTKIKESGEKNSCC